jgi:hypothetical protein
MNVLMTVAVAGAMVIGEWGEGASTVVLFSLAQLLEARSLERALSLLGHGEHQLLSLGIGRKLRDLDPNRSDRPGRSFVPDADGAIRGLDRVSERLGETDDRPRVGSDVDGVAPRHDDEHAGVSGRAAVGGGDRIPLPRARNSRDPCLDPAESAGICDVAAQLNWGSISP